AQGVEVDVLDDDHLRVLLGKERRPDHRARILLVPARQIRERPRDALRRPGEPLALRLRIDRAQNARHVQPDIVFSHSPRVYRSSPPRATAGEYLVWSTHAARKSGWGRGSLLGPTPQGLARAPVLGSVAILVPRLARGHGGLRRLPRPHPDLRALRSDQVL